MRSGEAGSRRTCVGAASRCCWMQSTLSACSRSAPDAIGTLMHPDLHSAALFASQHSPRIVSGTWTAPTNDIASRRTHCAADLRRAVYTSTTRTAVTTPKRKVYSLALQLTRGESTVSHGLTSAMNQDQSSDVGTTSRMRAVRAQSCCSYPSCAPLEALRKNQKGGVAKSTWVVKPVAERFCLASQGGRQASKLYPRTTSLFVAGSESTASRLSPQSISPTMFCRFTAIIAMTGKLFRSAAHPGRKISFENNTGT